MVGDTRLTRLLVFTRTSGYRHDSIPAACAALAGVREFDVHVTEQPDDVAECAGADAVVFLSTTGTVLHNGARAALRGYVEGGAGFVGIHGAALTEPDWPYFGELLGGRFVGHPEGVQTALTQPVHGHPSTDVLPDPWEVTDEWYAFEHVHPDIEWLLTVDETTYDPGAFVMAGGHPQAWCRSVGAGRSWYTALGHAEELWSDPVFLAHVAGGIRWAARYASGRARIGPE